MLELQKFIMEHPIGYEKLLTSSPYNLKIRLKDNRMLFIYDQINSDFSETIVRESRGIILDYRDYSILCHPLHKFFNLGEPHASEVDWNTAKVMSKIDGSLIKLYYYNNKWNVATNGTIDANDASLMFPTNEIKTFGDLFWYTLSKYNVNVKEAFSMLNPQYTYMFEIATPLNRVVVPYTDYHLFFITAKRNSDGFEVRDAITFGERIKSYSYNNIDEVIESVSALPYDDEGYVVVDEENNRIKIKSPKYVQVHRLKGDDVPTPRRIFNMILENDYKEFLSYFSEYHDLFENIKKSFDDYCIHILTDAGKLFYSNGASRFSTRKEFAQEAKKTTLPGLMFYMYDNGTDISIHEYVKNMNQKSKDQILEEIMS